MKIIVECPVGHRFRCDEVHLGKSVRCPHTGCGTKFVLRRSELPVADPGRSCPNCANSIEPQAAICTRCGLDLETGGHIETTVGAPTSTEPGASFNELLYGPRLRRVREPQQSTSVWDKIGLAIKCLLLALLALWAAHIEPPLFLEWIPAGVWKAGLLILAAVFGSGIVLAFIPDRWLHPREVNKPSTTGPHDPAQRDGKSSKTQPSLEEIHEQLRKLERSARNWKRGIATLVISILLFLLLGILRFEVGDLVMLAVVILIHELGHLLAMRIFGYRNLRIFLIPLFGGAAAGEKRNAPGWQRAIVALAGPLPGLAIGYILLIASMYADSSLPAIGAIMFIALNAINLAPLFPLDGGRFFNDVLFSRASHVETGFRAITALALAGLGLLTGAWLVAGFAGLVLLGTIHRARINSIATQLRRQLDPDVLTTTEEIPLAVAEPIIDAVCAKLGFRDAKVIAEVVADVWERLNTRPPRLLATIGLLAIYLASLASVVVVPVTLGSLVASGSLPAPSSAYLSRLVAGFEADFLGTSELHAACENHDMAAVAHFIASGEAIESRDDIGRTPLMYAARSGCDGCARMLIEAGAEIDTRDDTGHTALMLAAGWGNLATVHRLLDQSADVNVRCVNDKNALEHAMVRDESESERDRLLDLLRSWTTE